MAAPRAWNQPKDPRNERPARAGGEQELRSAARTLGGWPSVLRARLGGLRAPPPPPRGESSASSLAPSASAPLCAPKSPLSALAPRLSCPCPPLPAFVGFEGVRVCARQSRRCRLRPGRRAPAPPLPAFVGFEGVRVCARQSRRCRLRPGRRAPAPPLPADGHRVFRFQDSGSPCPDPGPLARTSCIAPTRGASS